MSIEEIHCCCQKLESVTPGRALSPLMTEDAGGEGRLLAPPLGSELRHACTVTKSYVGKREAWGRDHRSPPL